MSGRQEVPMAANETSVRLDADVLAELDRLAAAYERPREALIGDALRAYVEYERWFAEEVRKGLDSAENEPLTDHETVIAEVMAKLDRKGAAAQ